MSKSITTIQNAGKDVEEYKIFFFFFSWWECKVIQLWLFLTKWHMLLLYDPAIVYTGIYPSELKNHVHTKTYTRLFIAALFIIAKPGSNQDVFQ